MITKTYTPRPRDIERRWYVVDAEGVVLGRLASEVAKILRGKHKPMFATHMDTGDHVIVVNAAGIRMTGSKADQKVYYRHSGYPGGIREQPYGKLLAERPTLVVEKAIRGMLPKNRLGRQMISKLAVYAGPDHPHQAQKPEPLAVGAVPAWSGLPAPKPEPAAKAEPKAVKAAKPRRARRTGASVPTGAAGATAGRTRRAQARPASRASAGAVRRGAGTKKSAESSSESKPRSARSKTEPSKES